MKLSNLRPAPGSHKAERRIGRGHGSGRGKTAGRGTKGQKARSGGTIHRAFSDEYTIINVVDLDLFKASSQVNPETLVANGLMTPAQGRGLIKVLGNGEIDRALNVKAHKFSASARAKIEAAGGSIEIIPVRVYEKTKRRKDEKAN